MKSVLTISIIMLFFATLALSDSHGKSCGHAHGQARECVMMERGEEHGKECMGEHSKKECKKQECDMTVIANELVCPVMGNTFTLTKETPKVEHEGKLYFFCCNGCVREFKANPEKYIPGKE